MSFLEEYITEKLKGYTLVMIIQGACQSGKSTFTQYLMDCLSLKLFGELWDYEKYCARNLEEFINIYDKHKNRLIVFEEANADIDIYQFYNDLNRFFSLLMSTQQYRHNLVVLVMPSSAMISTRQRYFIKLGIEIEEKIDTPELKATIFKPTIYKRTYYKLDDNDLYYLYWSKTGNFVKYKTEDLERAKKYTDWLEGTLKKEVMDNIKAGMREHKHKERVKNINEEVEIKPIKAPRSSYQY